jgi:Tfp pilus assembly PilM family ATPase
MKTSSFFKLFPPPKFLEMPYAGIDISDSSVHCLLYRHGRRGLEIDRFGYRPMPKGIVEAGIIHDEKALIGIIKSLADELKITYVKASLPEERMYLFKTEVPDGTAAEIRENIELRLDENVPLPASDAVFYFDIIRDLILKSKHTASVSVAPQKFVESYLSVLEAAGLLPVSFELVSKSLARAIVPKTDTDTKLIIHLMDEKVGFYIVDEGVVLFTSTVPFNSKDNMSQSDIEPIHTEMTKVYGYWEEHGQGDGVSEIILCGHHASKVSAALAESSHSVVKTRVADVWTNAFSYDAYIPPILRDESLEYAVAAGLALPKYR